MQIGEPDARAQVLANLQSLKVESEKLNWSDLSAQIGRFERRLLAANEIDTDSFDTMATLFSELLGNVQHHLARDLFICIQNPKIDYLSRPREVFGEQVLGSFPSATYDLLESSRCFALDRWTATVSHLMRALEVPLSALGAVFGVSLAHTNWGPALDQIESRIREMHKDPIWKALPDCKEQQEFYAQAASSFGMFKDAWRNYTAHGRGKYDEREASDIMTAVRAFLQKLAPKLHE